VKYERRHPPDVERVGQPGSGRAGFGPL
jgi:hypothetical protein